MYNIWMTSRSGKSIRLGSMRSKEHAFACAETIARMELQPYRSIRIQVTDGRAVVVKIIQVHDSIRLGELHDDNSHSASYKSRI